MSSTVLVPKLGSLDLLSAAEVGGAWGLNILLYGVAGAGKTTLAATAQDSEHGRDVLYIDVEGGTLSISDRADVSVYRPASFADLRKVYDALAAGGHNFQTVVVDSLSEVQTLAAKEISPRGGTIDQREWGQINDRVINLVRSFRGLSHSANVNTIFTALEREEKDEATGKVTVRPDLTPGSYRAVTAACDAVGYLTFDPASGKRVLHLEGNGRFVAKTRQPASGTRLPAKVETPTLVPLLAKLREAQAERRT